MKKIGLFSFIGLIFGGMFGAPIGIAFENPSFAVTIGAFGGFFLGWFIAAISINRSK
jgi:amino acid transporter